MPTARRLPSYSEIAAAPHQLDFQMEVRSETAADERNARDLELRKR